MEFLETLKEKISTTSRAVVQKSNELVEITKLKNARVSEENAVNEILQKIGQSLYEAYKTGESEDLTLDESFAKLDEVYARIEELDARIGELKKTKNCPNCTKEMDKDAVYCSVCGEKFQ